MSWAAVSIGFNAVNVIIGTYSVSDQVYGRFTGHPLFRGDVKDAYDDMYRASGTYKKAAEELAERQLQSQNYRLAQDKLLSLFVSIGNVQAEFRKLAELLEETMAEFNKLGIKRAPMTLVEDAESYRPFYDRALSLNAELPHTDMPLWLFLTTTGAGVIGIGGSIYFLIKSVQQYRIERASQNRTGTNPQQQQVRNLVDTENMLVGSPPPSRTSSQESFVSAGSPPQRQYMQEIIRANEEDLSLNGLSSSARSSAARRTSIVVIEEPGTPTVNLTSNRASLAGPNRQASAQPASVMSRGWVIGGVVVSGLFVVVGVAGNVLQHLAFTDMKNGFNKQKQDFERWTEVVQIILDGTGKLITSEGANRRKKIIDFYDEVEKSAKGQGQPLNDNTESGNRVEFLKRDFDSDLAKAHLENGLKADIKLYDANIELLLMKILEMTANLKNTIRQQIERDDLKAAARSNSGQWVAKLLGEVDRKVTETNRFSTEISNRYKEQKAAAENHDSVERCKKIDRIATLVNQFIVDPTKATIREMKKLIDEVSSYVKIRGEFETRLSTRLDVEEEHFKEAKKRPMLIADARTMRPDFNTFLEKYWKVIAQEIKNTFPSVQGIRLDPDNTMKQDLETIYGIAWNNALDKHFNGS